MALVKCKECGKEMSDTARKCPNCGYHEKMQFKKKPIIIGVAVVVLVVIAGIIFGALTKEKPLTDLEQQAVECVLDYKAMLKNIDSLQVHDIRWVENDMVENMIFIYLDVSGQNGFGGNTRHVIRYGVKDKEVEFQGSDDDTSSSWGELIAGKIREDWEKLVEDDSSVISVDRVMNEVNKESDK